MKFAKWSYRIAGVYGLLFMSYLALTQAQYSQNYPPAVNHLELYYGFVFVTLAWQIAFLIISRDPARFRPLMPVTWLEKFSFTVITLVLYGQGQLAAPLLGGGLIDLVLGILFVISFFKTREQGDPKMS